MSRYRAAALALLLLLSVAALTARAEPSGRHALWAVQGKHNTIYLLGSVHFLTPEEELPAAVAAAYADAEALLMEIDLDDLDPSEAQQATLELGVLPADQSLESMIGAAAYRQVAAKAAELGVDPSLLSRFRPWLAAITLVQLQLRKMGLDPSFGVDQRLAARASADDKPITGLETLREQLGLLAALPEAQQREFLLYSVEDAERATREIEQLLDAWRRGDTEALGNLLSEGFQQYPDLYRPLTVDRNRKWVPKLESLLDDDQDYLVVVGALHLVGDDSVVELLERKGYKLRQQ